MRGRGDTQECEQFPCQAVINQSNGKVRWV